MAPQFPFAKEKAKALSIHAYGYVPYVCFNINSHDLSLFSALPSPTLILTFPFQQSISHMFIAALLFISILNTLLLLFIALLLKVVRIWGLFIIIFPYTIFNRVDLLCDSFPPAFLIGTYNNRQFESVWFIIVMRAKSNRILFDIDPLKRVLQVQVLEDFTNRRFVCLQSIHQYRKVDLHLRSPDFLVEVELFWQKVYVCVHRGFWIFQESNMIEATRCSRLTCLLPHFLRIFCLPLFAFTWQRVPMNVKSSELHARVILAVQKIKMRLSWIRQLYNWPVPPCRYVRGLIGPMRSKCILSNTFNVGLDSSFLTHVQRNLGNFWKKDNMRRFQRKMRTVEVLAGCWGNNYGAKSCLNINPVAFPGKPNLVSSPCFWPSKPGLAVFCCISQLGVTPVWFIYRSVFIVFGPSLTYSGIAKDKNNIPWLHFQVSGKPFCHFGPTFKYLFGIIIKSQLVCMALNWSLWASRGCTFVSTGATAVTTCIIRVIGDFRQVSLEFDHEKDMSFCLINFSLMLRFFMIVYLLVGSNIVNLCIVTTWVISSMVILPLCLMVDVLREPMLYNGAYAQKIIIVNTLKVISEWINQDLFVYFEFYAINVQYYKRCVNIFEALLCTECIKSGIQYIISNLKERVKFKKLVLEP
ncbi:hypothetical protein VP01_3000g1 [Puccinia sorghi]|uniref:Uncharacterized protein n=1 Tax=Puccinia sorghi TaxID=27349 RepID=A0A0L6V0F6_9BASI|nr:hypothetical protein VP01_3000g1 [Puccinia sorghi]